MGINGAFATRSPSGANKAQEKSSRSLIFVLIEVCCKDRPIASATLMKRFANSVSNIGSGPLVGVLIREPGVSDILRETVGCLLEKIVEIAFLYTRNSVLVPERDHDWREREQGSPGVKSWK